MTERAFNPELLTAVREYAGLTKEALAQQCGVSRRAVSGWESGSVAGPPTERLSAVLDVEEERFFDEAPPAVDSTNVSFRALSSLGARKTKAVLSAARFGVAFSQWLDRQFDAPQADVPSIDDLVSPLHHRDTSPQMAASLLRAKWRLADRPIRHMMETLERHGVRVYSLPRGERDVDAFSFWTEGRPYIFLNPEKSGERLRFDLAHELAHLVLHKGMATARAKQYEYEANQFASAFLMPADGVLSQVATASRQLSLQDVFTLKVSWRVSAVAMVRRLYDLGVLGDWHYHAWMRELSAQGYRREEPGGMSPERSKLTQQVLARMRVKGLTLSGTAAGSRMPLRALEDILSGFALLPLRGESEVGAVDPMRSAPMVTRGQLRVV